MQEEQQAFKVFLSMNHHKADVTSEPTAYLQFYDRKECAPKSNSLIAFKVEDVLETFDRNVELVRFLLHQMHTYDCTSQRILGLVFDDNIIMSDVLRVPQGCNPGPSA